MSTKCPKCDNKDLALIYQMVWVPLGDIHPAEFINVNKEDVSRTIQNKLHFKHENHDQIYYCGDCCTEFGEKDLQRALDMEPVDQDALFDYYQENN